MRRIPRISTRGYYDLTNGERIKIHDNDSRYQNIDSNYPYRLYPRRYFDGIAGVDEVAIMVHGMRNDSSGAIQKVMVAQQRLEYLGYDYPVVGFSYDSNVRGAHIASRQRDALKVAQKIADMNGCHLGEFIKDFKQANPNVTLRVMGHSLGSQVIFKSLRYLMNMVDSVGISLKEVRVKSVHLFGASIPANAPTREEYGKILMNMVSDEIVNYYAPTDEVLGDAHDSEYVRAPLGLCGVSGVAVSKYRQIQVKPENHRFASYADVLESFP